MKKAILSLNVGDNPGYRYNLKSMKDYSEKIGADFFIADKIVIKLYHFFFEKLQCLSLFNQDYDQVLYLDADVMVTPKSENIFEVYSDVNKFYAHHENADSEDMDRDIFVRPLLTDDFDWPLLNGRYQYFNAGVMLFGRESWKEVISGIDNPPNKKEVWEFGDQTFLNYLVAKNKVKFESLDRKFNWMNCGKPDPNKHRYSANFIHYAGPCLYGESKNKVMEDDYKELYNQC